MRRKLATYIWSLLLAFFLTPAVLAQFTTVSGTLTDTDGTVWNEATVTAQFKPTPGFSGKYTWNGQQLNTFPPVVTTADGSGNFSFSVPSNTSIVPANSTWVISIAPRATTVAVQSSALTVTGGTQDITGFLAPFLTAPRMNPGQIVNAMTTTELLPIPGFGQIYFNTVSLTPFYWNGTVWVPFSGGGSGGCSVGGVATTNGIVDGDTTSTNCGTNNRVANTVVDSQNIQTFGYWNLSQSDGSTVTSNMDHVVTLGDLNGWEGTYSGGQRIKTQASEAVLIGDRAGAEVEGMIDVVAIGDFPLCCSHVSEYPVDGIEDVVAIGDVVGSGILPNTTVSVYLGVGDGGISSLVTQTSGGTEQIGIGDSSNTDAAGTDTIGIGDTSLGGWFDTGTHTFYGNTGHDVIAIGNHALAANSTGSDNVAIGDYAGCNGCTAGSGFQFVGNGNATGSHNVWIGDSAGPNTPTQLSNTIAIGYQAYNTVSNQTVIGNSSTTSVTIFGVGTGCLSATLGVITGSGSACGSGGGGGSNVTVNGGSTLTTANFNTSTPAAGTNGINVTWQNTGANISAEIVGDGNSAHFLNGTGTFTTPAGGVSGSGTIGFVPLWTGTTALGNSHIDDGVTVAGLLTATEDISIVDGSGLGGGGDLAEGTAPTAGTGIDTLWADSAGHWLKFNPNNTGARFVAGVATAGTATHMAVFGTNGIDLVDGGAPGGSGTVTTVSDLSPLFTTTNRTTTPTFNLTAAAAHNFFGNNTGGTATPGYFQPAFTDLSGSHSCAQSPALTGDATSSAGSCATSVTGLPLSHLATQAADTVDMNATGSSAVPTAIAMPTCTTGADLYNTSTHSWSCVSTGIVTGALTNVSATSPATVNLTSTGTRDWLCTAGSASTPRNLAANTLHAKASGQTGGLLTSSFNWVSGGNTTTIFTQNFANTAVTSTGSDDLMQAGLSSSIAGQGISAAAGGATGYGFTLTVPADTTSRTLKIYTGVFSGTLTATATLSDGSVAPATATVVTTAGAALEDFFTITFNAASSGEFLTVTVLLTTNLGSTPNVKFLAATLS